METQSRGNSISWKLKLASRRVTILYTPGSARAVRFLRDKLIGIAGQSGWQLQSKAKHGWEIASDQVR